MKIGELAYNLIRTGALTIMGDYAMRAINKKDFSALIKVTGISSVTVDVIKYGSYLKDNPPWVFEVIIKIGEFLEKGKV